MTSALVASRRSIQNGLRVTSTIGNSLLSHQVS
jgi:hypothetical protein